MWSFDLCLYLANAPLYSTQKNSKLSEKSEKLMQSWSNQKPTSGFRKPLSGYRKQKASKVALYGIPIANKEELKFCDWMTK